MDDSSRVEAVAGEWEAAYRSRVERYAEELLEDIVYMSAPANVEKAVRRGEHVHWRGMKENGFGRCVNNLCRRPASIDVSIYR